MRKPTEATRGWKDHLAGVISIKAGSVTMTWTLCGLFLPLDFPYVRDTRRAMSSPKVIEYNGDGPVIYAWEAPPELENADKVCEKCQTSYERQRLFKISLTEIHTPAEMLCAVEGCGLFRWQCANAHERPET